MPKEPLVPVGFEFDARSNHLHIKSEGPEGGPYTLTLDFSEQTVSHSYEHPPNRTFTCPIEDLEILPYRPICDT